MTLVSGDNHKYMIAAKMLREGHSRKAIAECMCVTVWQVNCYIGYAKRQGVSVKIDLEASMLKNLPPPVVVWLKGQVPEGGTVGDVVCAILTDVYHEDMESCSGKPTSSPTQI